MISRMMNRNFQKITQAIDVEVGKAIEIKKYVTDAWELARRPVLLAQEYNTWLVIVPTGIFMTPILVRNNMLRTTISIKGYTQTITSREKPDIKAEAKLPNLVTVEKMPEDFRVGLISMIPYQEASRLAGARFVGEVFSFANGKYKIEVTSIDMYGQNEFLVIKAGLRGSLNGTVYLKGIPYYDPATKNLFLKNLNYDLDSQNILLKTANWLLQGKFSKLMEQKLVFPIGGQITETHATIQNALSKNTLARGIVLDGTLHQITPDKVYLTPDHIYSVVFATGRATLRIEGML